MKSTENPLYRKYFSLFENSSRTLISSANKDNETSNLAWEKSAYEFSVNLNHRIKINAQSILDQINKERELFIAATKLTYYSIIALKDNGDWIYDSGPIALSLLLSQEGVAAQIYEKLEQNHLMSVSSDSLREAINHEISVILNHLKKKYTDENKLEKFTLDMQSVENEAIALFERLFFTPWSFDKIELQHHLLELVSLNTPYLIRAVTENIQMDVTELLPKAMRKLSFETLQVLVELGADLNKEILLYRDADMNLQIYGPILLYPFLPLILKDQMQLGIFGECCYPLFRLDHPKLINMMSYLLEHGADPNQEITLAPIRLFHDDKGSETDKEKLEKEQMKPVTLKHLAQQFNDDELNQFTPCFTDFITKIANWTPETTIKSHVPTQEEINAYIEFVTTQFTGLRETDWYQAWCNKQNERVESSENIIKFRM